MAYTARFNFIGEPLISRKSDDSFVRRWTGGKGNKSQMASMRFGVKESKTNSIWVECFGMTYDSIKTMRDDGERIEIPWEDRLDESIVESVPNYRKYIAEFDEGEKQFLSKYDFIAYLEEKLPEYKGNIFCSGRYRKSPWKGEVYDQYDIDVVRATTAEKGSLHVKMDLFYNKDCVDKSDFADKKRIIVDGFISQYINKDEGEKYFPQRVVLDVSKFDDSEQHQKYAKMLLMDVDIKSDEMVHLTWDCKVIRGAETVEFDEDMLTERQKQQIECGMATIDDFAKPIGENIYELRFFKQLLNGDFVDGPVESGFSYEELQEQLYMQPDADVSMKDIEKAAAKKDEANDDDLSDSTLEDLLG